MKLILTMKEKRELLTTSLQHLNESLQMWEHTLEYTTLQYSKAKQMVIARQKVKTESICYEDVICEIMLGNNVAKFIDDDDAENVVIFSLELFNENIDKCALLDIASIFDEQGNYDFTTTDNVLQCLIFGEVVYG